MTVAAVLVLLAFATGIVYINDLPLMSASSPIQKAEHEIAMKFSRLAWDAFRCMRQEEGVFFDSKVATWQTGGLHMGVLAGLWSYDLDNPDSFNVDYGMCAAFAEQTRAPEQVCHFCVRRVAVVVPSLLAVLMRFMR